MRLRDVELGDVGAYVRMRCDPVMTTELGGRLPREGIEDKVARDVQAAAAGTESIKMIVPDEASAEVVAGSVALWSHGQGSGEPVTEIGWMVLPEFQGADLRSGRCGCCSSWPATMAGGGSYTRSRRQPTPRRTASAAPSASGSPVSRT